MRQRTNSGQTIIEVIIAVGLIVLVLTTLVAGIVLGIRNNRAAREQSLAKDHVREGTEWVRQMRDTLGWDSFSAIIRADAQGTPPVDVHYCVNSLPSNGGTFDALTEGACLANSTIANSIYTRDITFTVLSADEIKAIIKVTWLDRGAISQSYSTLTLRKWL